MELTKDTPVACLTLGQLEDWIKSIIQNNVQKSEPRFAYGIAGIMKLFGCSEQTAMRLRNGAIKDAVIQNVKGGKLVVDVDKALELFAKTNM